MPSYKLTYFKHWGRAGVLRLLFAAGGIEFEDVRIDRETQWPDFKPRLAGKTPLEEARIDMIVDGLADMETIFAGLYREKDEKTKLENMKKFAGETLPMFLNNFEKLASSSGHFVGDVLTWADVDFFAMVFFAKDHLPYDPLTGYANLTKVIDNVTSNPRIAEWMKKEAAQ
uniref:glutathione transferase n=1 Tax=Branchiostoma floridae TaxID=7739 RepID=C3YE43_BRAFL|eukprot:XP_002605341.1 hypothetical protein BRAFLDRAFT_74164 [Branchiostoma floridae]